MAKPSKVSKFFKTLLTILLVLIILITVGINILFFKPSSAPSLFGNSIYIMQQDNMEKVPLGDAVISSSKQISNLEVGNTVLCLTSFDNEFKEVLKLINITQEEGTTYYYVRSDTETDADALKLTQDKILAKCLWTNSSLGSAINFAKTTLGIAILVLVPCIILLIMKITSTLAQRKEEEKEEELRKSNPKKTKKVSNKNNKDVETEDKDVKPSKPKKKSSSLPSSTGEINTNKKTSNKGIPVKTLSEEESIRQREDISNMIGSELNSNGSKERTREFNSSELTVSSIKNVNAIKIDEDDILADENVHSPNMNEKADKIRKALSGHSVNDSEAISPIVSMTTDEVKNVESSVSSVVIVPETKVETPNNIKSSTIKQSYFNADDFLKDIIGEDQVSSKNSSQQNSKVSDDILDQLLNSIPSTHKTEEVKKPVSSVSKPVRKVTKKPERHSSKSIKTPKITNKMVDNTSFDELIKAIEKEKNSIK